MTFVAEFDDGPMDGASHIFIGADRPYADLYVMPNPSPSSAMPWLIVGYTGLEPDEPWPGQVHYALLATELLHEPVGHYVFDTSVHSRPLGES